jgi:hypothetical protein
MENRAVRQITVNDRTDIKQLLCSDYIVGIRDTGGYAFGGFELWWYDRENDICRCRRSRWSDFRRQIEEHSLDHAASLLWLNRGTLFLRHRRFTQDGNFAFAAQSNN